MKKIFVFFVSVALFVACAPQKTCPTYLKNDSKPATQVSKV
ncbi:MAG: hypothetical protein SFY32_06050 [Bacteroidota bacterium]|nr:hypothetical protein [Bacteroidota bacterium]